MADADRNPVVSIDPQYLVTAEVVERAPTERSKHHSVPHRVREPVEDRIDGIGLLQRKCLLLTQSGHWA